LDRTTSGPFPGGSSFACPLIPSDVPSQLGVSL
jgi:hypothetical protein